MNFFHDSKRTPGASQVALVVKNPPANTGDVREAGPIPGSGRSPGGGHGNPLQYSRLENPMDRRAWRATVHRVAKSQTQLCDQMTMNIVNQLCFNIHPISRFQER